MSVRTWCFHAVLIGFAVVFAGCGDRARCAGDGDCATGSTCSTDGACRPEACTTDRECVLGAVCETGSCRPGCRSSLDCPTDSAICDSGAGPQGACVGCRRDDDCATGLTCVEASCRQACRDDQNCASGHCDTAARWCIECSEDAHCQAGEVCLDQRCAAGCDDDRGCPTAAPHCDPARGPAGACLQCLADAECAPGTCGADGACIAPPAPPLTALDVLVVVDDSASMVPNQRLLTASFPAFIEELDRRLGTRPDLHIGIISTNMGGSPVPTDRCTGDGDGGRLIKREPCVLTDGAFLRDSPLPGGLRDTNYEGQLAEAFTCLASLGADGCGYEQPLLAIRAALAPGANVGFRRPDAGLVVILLTNEDDCSAADPALFLPGDEPFGPPSSYRCFQHGIRCEPDVATEEGTRTACQPRVSPLFHPIDSFVELLRGQVQHQRLVFGLIAGPGAPVVVERDERGQLDLVPSCGPNASDDIPSADPAIRLLDLASKLGPVAVVGSACDDHAEPLRTVAARAAALFE